MPRRRDGRSASAGRVTSRSRVASLRGRWRDERGALTLFLAILFPALLAFAGLVVDAGTKLDNYENASTFAQEAARAGAGQVNQSAAYGSATLVVDQAEAIAAARAYLAAAGVAGTVTTVGNNAIRVSVTITTPTRILSLVGIDTVTSTSTATASLLSGVTGPGS